MERGAPPQTKFVVPAAVLAALVAAGVLVQPAPYKDSRPPQTERWPEAAEDVQDAEARLWEDPFGAARRHERELRDLKSEDSAQASEKALHSAAKARQSIHQAGPHLKVMAVIVPGAPYPESAELRRRLRYGVLSALDRFDLVPAQSGHLGYFRTRQNRSREIAVPFEFFEANPLGTGDTSSPGQVRDLDSTRQKAVLLWIDSEALEINPTQSLTDIFADLGVICSSDPHRHCSNQHSVSILGPTDSDMLLSLLIEACKAGMVADHRFEKIAFYSPFATIAPSELKIVLSSHDECKGQSVEDLLNRRKILRVAVDDGQLASALLRELDLRGVRPACAIGSSSLTSCGHRQRHRIALISERDALFGRAFPISFKRAIAVHAGAEARNDDHVYIYGYLRGLDGAVAQGRQEKEDRGADKGTPEGATKPRAPIERPEGNAQLDYLRRLSDQIAEVDAQLSRDTGDGFGAIGVIGTDPYDKLLILQALRQRLPGKAYFTTDLDSRFLHPAEQEWTRNVLVATTFGLQLRKELQRYTPPFRDSQQTGSYLAMMAALSEATYEDKQGWLLSQLAPTVFEIGRNNAFAFNNGAQPSRLTAEGPAAQTWKASATDAAECRPWALLSCQAVLPSASQHYPAMALTTRGTAGTAAVLALGLIVVFWPPGKSGLLWTPRIAVVLVSCALAALLFSYWDSAWNFLFPQGDFDGKPVALFEGISIWPAEMLRAFAAGLAVWLFSQVCLRVRQSERAIEREFGLANQQIPLWELMKRCTSQRVQPVSGGQWRSSVYRACETIRCAAALVFVQCRDLVAPPRQEGVVEADATWRLYRSFGDYRLRAARIVLATVSFVMLGTAVFQIWPVYVPYRGAFSQKFDFAVIMFTVIVFNLLTMAVLEATWLATQLIDHLARQQSIRWSSATLKTFSARLSASGKPLAAWIAIQLVGRMTERLTSIVYFPFLVLLLMIFARSSAFDHWEWEPSLILAFGWSTLLALASAIYLRRAAERLRGRVIEQLTADLLKAQGLRRDAAARQIELMIREVKSNVTGAFAPLSEQPFLRAILLPLAGTAGSVLIEYATRANY